ncbi:hypothetical protein [Isoptericola aurantiacus]|uniref:hypothetical protein n=1 Tax=Isoptericola aurantiacus TaxID=3377839 RepID=UPI00383B5FCD
MATDMQPSERQDVFKRFDLIELCGQMQTNRRTKSSTVEVQLEGLRHADNDDALNLRAVATMKGEDPDTGEAFEIYEGSAQYFLIVNPNGRDLTDDELVVLVWPSLRTVLTSHAKMLGARSFKVPFAIEPEVSPGSADSVAAPAE